MLTCEEYIKTIIKNAYIELLAGIAETYNGGVKSVNWFGHECYIHFPDPSNSKQVFIRYYWESGGIEREQNYYNGKLHGRNIVWDLDGIVLWDHEYKNGEMIEEKVY